MKVGEIGKMKKGILLGLSLTTMLSVFGAACQQTATVNTNSSLMNHNSLNHDSMMNSNHDMSGMSDMKSSPNAASAPYDLQFLDTMTHHHQGAVDMAKMVLMKSNNDELKKFAQKIIEDQNKEIASMKDWREKWFAGKPAAMNMEMPGMMDSMKMMMSGDDMKKMEAMTGKDFDIQFLDMMTPHHAGAITMSKEALQKAEHPEVKTLANNIIKAQESEIKQMSDWKAKWSK